MPQNITEVSEFTAPVSVPADGDVANANSVKGAFQALANRDKFLHDLAVVNGIRKIRSVADRNALRALTGMSEGEIVMTSGVADMGLWHWNSGSTLATATGFIEQPNAGGVGRWINLLVYLRTTGGFSGTETRLNTSVLPAENRIVAIDQADDQAGSYAIPAGGTWTDVGTTAKIFKLLNTGDKVQVQATVIIRRSDPAGTMEQRIVADLGGAITQIKFQDPFDIDSNNNVAVPLMGVFTAPSGGTYTFKIQARTQSTTNGYTARSPYIQTTVIRP